MAPDPARPDPVHRPHALMRRLAALALVAVALAPGTWWRTAVPLEAEGPLDRERIQADAEMPEGVPLTVTDIWQVKGSGLGFGGFSALLVADGELRAFSDRGWMLAFDYPDAPSPAYRLTDVEAEDGHLRDLWDVESATSTPDGRYWLGFEYEHAVQRFTPAGRPDGVRMLGDEVDWASNAGLEGMVYLPDGRFIFIPEWANQGFVLPGDPVDGTELQAFGLHWPADDYGATDAALLPDGRLLVLLRAVDWDVSPPFASLLAIGDSAAIAPGETWAPELLVRLDDILPRENYEGLDVRALPDGAVEIWMISDDNFSALQRTLLVRLVLDPAAPGSAQEKARED